MVQTRLIKKEEILKLETRRRIYEFILKNPGLHFSGISRKLKIPKTTLTFHLNNLEKHGLITSIYEDRNSRFFVKQHFGNLEKKLIHLLRKETPRNIVLYIGWVTCASQVELSRELEKSNKTIEKHLKKLLELGVIEPVPIENGVMYTVKNMRIIDRKLVGREVIYRLALTSNPNISFGDLIGSLFTLYGKGLVNDSNTRLILDGLHQLRPKKGLLPKRIKTGKVILEDLEKAAYDIFPHPYHV